MWTLSDRNNVRGPTINLCYVIKILMIVKQLTESEFVLENGWISAKFNGEGHLIGLFDKHEARELVPSGKLGNLLKLYDDVPPYWLNWDIEIYHLNTGRKAGTAKAKVGEIGPLRATIVVEHKLSETSSANQTIVLTSVSPRIEFHLKVNWDEVQTLLVRILRTPSLSLEPCQPS